MIRKSRRKEIPSGGIFLIRAGMSPEGSCISCASPRLFPSGPASIRRLCARHRLPLSPRRSASAPASRARAHQPPLISFGFITAPFIFRKMFRKTIFRDIYFRKNTFFGIFPHKNRPNPRKTLRNEKGPAIRRRKRTQGLYMLLFSFTPRAFARGDQG